MEILEKAISITSKYGISLHKFGPFLSYYDNKIGICLDIKDSKFGYLSRNYQFENLFDFEKFLKTYSYYKNVLKGNTNIILDDYKNVSPRIKYGFEEKKLIDKKNEEIEITEIKKAGDSLYLYLEKLYNLRIEQLELRQKAYDKMNENLINYKKNLYTFYNKEYEEEFKNSDGFLNNYKITTKGNLKQFIEYNNLLKNSYKLDDVRQSVKKLILLLKKFELDRDYFSSLYDYYLFKNKSYLLVQMSDHILKRIESKNNITPQELKIELEEIKTKIVFSNSKDLFIKDEFDKIEEKYSGIFKIEEYNAANYLENKELKKLEFIKCDDTQNNNNIYSDLDNEYNKLKSLDKKELLILFSPLGKIISHMYNNISEDIDSYLIYEDYYHELLELLNIPENIIFKNKYFSVINFNSFKDFISSLISITKNLMNINININKNFNVWSYPTERMLINASYEVLKSGIDYINLLQVKAGANILFSNKKICLINEKLVIEDNKNIFIKKDNNIINKNDTLDIVNDYIFCKNLIKINNKEYSIVNGIDEVITYKYYNYNVEANYNE